MKRRKLNEAPAEVEKLRSDEFSAKYRFVLYEVAFDYYVDFREAQSGIQCGNLYTKQNPYDNMTETKTSIMEAKDNYSIYEMSKEILRTIITDHELEILYFNHDDKYIEIAAGEIANELDMHEVKKDFLKPDITYVLARKDFDDDFVEELYHDLFNPIKSKKRLRKHKDFQSRR